MSDKNKWEWIKETQKAFETLKEWLTMILLLQLFDTNKLVIVEADASDRALGVALS
jgi:hypothetical protein